jgi:hypothetical protein
MLRTVETHNPTTEGYGQIVRQLLGEQLTVLTGSETISRQKIEHTNSSESLRIVVPDFNYLLSAPIVEISSRMEAGEVTLRIAIGDDLLILVALNGRLSDSDGLFHIDSTSLRIDGRRNRARSDFIASTFWAMFSLAKNISLQLPELQLDLNLKVDLDLAEISEMLQRRLLAYRIMVIERATARSFELPSYIAAEDVKSTALIYHAIVHRSFIWPIGFVDYGWPATKEVLEQLVKINELPVVKLGPHPKEETLFGQLIPLGDGFVTLFDKVIDEFQSVLNELKLNDGHVVHVTIRSLSGRGAYDLPDAPKLPIHAWESNILNLINLESSLNEKLVQRYDDLAAGTLADLTEQERSDVTERPNIVLAGFEL